jgi:hypothetical protein
MKAIEVKGIIIPAMIVFMLFVVLSGKAQTIEQQKPNGIISYTAIGQAAYELPAKYLQTAYVSIIPTNSKWERSFENPVVNNTLTVGQEKEIFLSPGYYIIRYTIDNNDVFAEKIKVIVNDASYCFNNKAYAWFTTYEVKSWCNWVVNF